MPPSEGLPAALDGLGSTEKNDRKSTTPPLRGALERSIRIEDFETARQILRDGDLRQAGFAAEIAELHKATNRPILYQRGEVHQKLRSAVAWFFAPKVVTTPLRTNIPEGNVRCRVEEPKMRDGIAVEAKQQAILRRPPALP